MITRIATVPGTPLLIPAVAAGAAQEIADVRHAALGRVAWAGGPRGRVSVLAQDPSVSKTTRRDVDSCVSLASLGLNECLCGLARESCERVRDADVRPSATELPVAVLVAAWLADRAGVEIDGVWSVPTDPESVTLPEGLAEADAVVLIADGSAARTPKAPAALVEGAVDFDEQLIEAISSVDVAFFHGARRGADARDFEVQGLGAWAAAVQTTGLLPGHWVGEVDIAADPYGVLYMVAGWSVVE